MVGLESECKVVFKARPLKKESMLKRLGELVASFSVIIIVFGLIKQMVYYLRFNVPIKYFIGLTEIGLIVSDDLIMISVFFGCFLLLVLMFNNRQVTWEEEKRIHEERQKVEEGLTGKDKKFVRKLNLFTVIVMIILFLAPLFLVLTTKDYFVKCLALFLLIMCIDLIVLEFGKKLIYQNLTRSSMFGLVAITLFLGILIVKSGFETQSVVKGRYTGTKIITEDSTYVSDSAHYFIGKTENYVFIYNVQDSATDIIPNDEVRHIFLKSR